MRTARSHAGHRGEAAPPHGVEQLFSAIQGALLLRCSRMRAAAWVVMSAAEVAKQGFEAMQRGEADVVAG